MIAVSNKRVKKNKMWEKEIRSSLATIIWNITVVVTSFSTSRINRAEKNDYYKHYKAGEEKM